MAFKRKFAGFALTNDERSSSFLLGSIIFVGLLLAISASTANAFTFPKNPNLPQCTDAKVEARIFRDFKWAEKKTWQRGVDLVSLSRLHEHRTVKHDGSIVTRRYCMADAHLSNGKKRSLYYMINDRGGFAGVSWKVTHCIIGLDPWKNHDGYCRAIR